VTLPVILTRVAEREVADALVWYGDRSDQATRSFMDELDSLLRRMAERPLQFPPIAGPSIRRASFRRFPYFLLFRLGVVRIDVFACFHTSRDPAQWQARIQRM
jgi:plasmid stabilization system protein ParE